MNTNNENKKTGMFGENEIFELNQDCVNSDHDGEKVILDISSGTYYKANATASEILKILESPKSFNDIKNIISQRYPSKDNSIASDLKNFLEAGIKSKIILVKKVTS